MNTTGTEPTTSGTQIPAEVIIDGMAAELAKMTRRAVYAEATLRHLVALQQDGPREGDG